jgi:hypothetical protein
MNKIKKALESKKFMAVICVIGFLFITFVIFQAGMIAGFHKATFGRDWGDNYNMNFNSPRMGPQMMIGEFGDARDIPNAHGSIGKIIKIELPTMIVLDEKDNTEKVILLSDQTEIREMRNSLTKDKLKIDDHVVVIGTPNSSGQIEASLIRLMPAPINTPIKTN